MNGIKLLEFPRYVIYPDGRVYSEITNQFLTGSYNPAGYHNFRLCTDTGHILTIGLHRLLAIAFIPTQYDISKLYVNHINGNKKDNRIENLEWCTPRENCKHAGYSNLSSKFIAVKVKDISTNKITYFESILDCANFYNMSKDSISYRVNNPHIRYPENRQYVRHNTDFPNINQNHGNCKSLYIVDTFTDKEYWFDSFTEAAEFLNVPLSTLSVKLSKNHDLTYREYFIMKVNSPLR